MYENYFHNFGHPAVPIIKLFAAIRPPRHIIHTLTRHQKGVSGAKWSDPEKLHITLGYFGEVEDEIAEILDTELARHHMTGFEVKLTGAGHFGNAEPHAIWIGVKPSEPLRALHRHCRRAARRATIEMESRNFIPHVTMAYMKRDPNIARIIAFEKRLVEFEAGPFLVDEFFLFSSWQTKNGPNIYRKEASYPLLG